MPGEPVPTRGACGQAGQPFSPFPPFSAARSRTSASKDLVGGPWVALRPGRPPARVAGPASSGARGWEPERGARARKRGGEGRGQIPGHPENFYSEETTK